MRARSTLDILLETSHGSKLTHLLVIGSFKFPIKTVDVDHQEEYLEEDVGVVLLGVF
jgi:hypothetical protein